MRHFLRTFIRTLSLTAPIPVLVVLLILGVLIVSSLIFLAAWLLTQGAALWRSSETFRLATAFVGIFVLPLSIFATLLYAYVFEPLSHEQQRIDAQQSREFNRIEAERRARKERMNVVAARTADQRRQAVARRAQRVADHLTPQAPQERDA